MRGCRTCKILATGNHLSFRKFSGSVAASDLYWHELFEDYFGNSLSSKSSEKQLASSAASLVDIFKKTERSRTARRKPPQGELSEKELQLFEDLGPWKVFNDLIDELSVDHAVLLCNKLPANHFNSGIDALVGVLLERVQQSHDACDQEVLAENILALVNQLKGRNCTLSEGTDQCLQKWLLSCMHAQDDRHVGQVLCQEKGNLPHVEDVQRALQPDYSYSTEDKDTPLVTRGLADLLDNAFEKSKLCGVFNAIGKSASKGKSKQMVLPLPIYQTGVLEEDLEDLIFSFTKGLIEAQRDLRNMRRIVDIFKSNTTTIKLNTGSSFNLLIAHCANHGEIDLCIDLIQTMKARGLQPCPSSYEPLIKYFSRTLQISKAEDILRMMNLSGLHATTKSYVSLIAAHAKTDNLERAYNLIEGIPSEDLTADIYTPIIHAYGAKKRLSLALSVLKQMKRRNVNPNGDNFTSLVLACANTKNCKGAEQVFKLYTEQGRFSQEEDKAIVLAMLRVYADCGDTKRVDKLVAATHADVSDSPEVKSILLRGFAKTGRVEEALQVYNELRDRGIWPESGAFSFFLGSLGRAGKLDQLLELFELFRKALKTRKKSRLEQEEKISIACSNIVHALISHNNLEGAVTFLQRIQLEDAGEVETLCLKVFIEDKAINGNPQRVSSTVKEKFQFLEAMRERLRIQPTRLAYESLLECCAKEKDTYHAEAVLGLMRSDKLELNVFTYLILLRIAVVGGDFQRAQSLAMEMKRTMKSNGLGDKDVKFLMRTIWDHGFKC